MKELFWILIILGVVFTVTLINPSSANATTDWRFANPKLLGRAEIPNAAPQDMFGCGGYEIPIDVHGFGRFERACIYGNVNTVRIARSGQFYAIAFHQDTQFYELKGVCQRPKCVYSAAIDSLLMHHYLGNGNYGIGLYKNVSHSIKKYFNVSAMRTYFQFEPPGEPEFILKMGDIEPSVESVAFSQNGQFALIEMRSYGFVRLNTATYEVRRIKAPGSIYGLLNDPYYELAITNDGTGIALAGYRGSTTLYSIDETCGDVLNTSSGTQYKWGTIRCRQSELNIYAYIPDFYQTFNPKFNSDGTRFALSVLRRDGVVERFIFGDQSASLDYLALGDSFTSGEGEENDAYYNAATIGGDPGCHVSVRSYPYLLADLWQANSHNVACSGARTVDIVGNGDTYLGQSKFLSGRNGAQLRQAREDALGSFQSGIIPQASFVSEYQPRSVSISIGGNDAGLVGKLMGCLNIGVCEWVSDPKKKRATAEELKAVYPKIREVIQAVRFSAPSTKVAAIGYPLIINDISNAKCDLIMATLLQPEERLFINESIRYLNRIIKAAANAENVAFVDVESAFNQNRLCDTSNTQAMNGIRLGDDVAPLSVLKDFRIFGNESFHPTFRGHHYLAQTIFQEIPSIETIQPCGACTQNEVPMPSAYWGDESVEYVQQVDVSFTDEHVYEVGDEVAIHTDTMQFLPGSSVVVEVHSNPVELMRGTTDNTGVFKVNIPLPRSIPSGYHTIHLLGTSPGGELIDVYRGIAIVENITSNTLVTNRILGSSVDKLDSTGGLARNNRVRDINGGVLAEKTSIHESPSDKNPSFGKDESSPFIALEVLFLGLSVVLAVVLIGIGGYRLRRYSHDRGG